MISWLMQIAPEEEMNAEGIASRLIAVNFAAIHTSGMVSATSHNWGVKKGLISMSTVDNPCGLLASGTVGTTLLS
jgi:hypothetical protein